MSDYREREVPDLVDAQDMADQVRERSEWIADAANYWFEQGWDDFRPEQDIDVVAGRLDSRGHPHLVKAYREGWEIARKDEEQIDAQAPATA